MYVTIVDSQGNEQILISNAIHPFFAKVPYDTITPVSSEGHDYQGEIDHGVWVDASNLQAGYQLLSEDGTWQTIKSVSITKEALTAYNLTVDNTHTYFASAQGGKYGVWVHNADCCDLNITPNGKTLPKGESIFNTKDGNGQTIAIYKGKDGQWYRTSDYNKTDARPYNIPKISTDRTPKKGSDIPHESPIRAYNGLIYQSNPKHTKGRGGKKSGEEAELEPINSLDLFDKSIASSNPNSNKRFAIDSNGVVQQFSYTPATNAYHWSGTVKKSEYDAKIPNDVQKKLGVSKK